MDLNSIKKLLPCLLLIFFSACKDKPQQLSKDEAIEFAKQMERSIRKGDGSVLDKGFDKDVFIERMHLPNSTEAKGFSNGIAEHLDFGTKITSELSDHISFQFIKHYIKDDKHHVIFRLFDDKESTLNYHDYELLKKHDKCLVADVYIYMSGETLAETMGNLFKTLYDRVDEAGEKGLGNIDNVKEIKELVQKGKSAEAKKMFDELPAYLKKSKAILLLNVSICSNLSSEEYDGAIKAFREAFPDEPNMNLMMIDGYYLQKDYEKMLAAVNALDSQINKDPLLDYYRYMSYKLMEDKATAKTYLKQVVKNMPEFQGGYIEWIAVDLKEKNTAEADSLIAVYRKKRFDQKELDLIVNYYRLLN